MGQYCASISGIPFDKAHIFTGQSLIVASRGSCRFSTLESQPMAQVGLHNGKLAAPSSECASGVRKGCAQSGAIKLKSLVAIGPCAGLTIAALPGPRSRGCVGVGHSLHSRGFDPSQQQLAVQHQAQGAAAGRRSGLTLRGDAEVTSFTLAGLLIWPLAWRAMQIVFNTAEPENRNLRMRSRPRGEPKRNPPDAPRCQVLHNSKEASPRGHCKPVIGRA